MIDITVVIQIDDEHVRADRVKELALSRLSSLLALGVYEAIDVTVRMARPGTDPTIVHARDGRVRTERESHPPSSEE